MGGSFTNTTSCDVPTIYGMHNMDLGKQNPVNQNWAKFNPNLTSYKLPTEIISVIGGSYVFLPSLPSNITSTPSSFSLMLESLLIANTIPVLQAAPTSNPPPTASTTATSRLTSDASTRLPRGLLLAPSPAPPRPPTRLTLLDPSVRSWAA